jgi:enterochelin esterase-like enzyme
MKNMFDFTDNWVSPLEMAILVSEEYADKIIKTFKERWTGYGNPSQFLSDIADEILPNAESLLPASKKRIEKEINNYLGVYNV